MDILCLAAAQAEVAPIIPPDAPDDFCARRRGGEEHLGAIMEREQAYQDAAEHYHRAWHTDDCVDAHIGFKLAFNYLKAKRYVEAIDVCRAVLDKYPDYPKIRREILEKAQAAVRA